MMSLFLTIALILCAFLVPAKQLIRPEYFIVTALGIIALVMRGKRVLGLVGKEFFLVYAMIVAAAMSLMVQVIVGSPFVPRDFMILLRYLIYSMAIVAGSYAAMRMKREWPIKTLLMMIIVCSIVISFLQYFNMFGINKLMVPLYGEKYQTLITGASWRRIIGTIGNANYWGLWLSICLVATGYYTIVKRNILMVPIVLALFLSIVMTGSRTAMLSCLFGLGWGILLSMGYIHRVSAFKKALTVISLSVLALLLFSSYTYFMTDYYEDQSRFSLKNTHTFELRIKHWSNFLSETIESPYRILIGRGPTKSGQITYGDNSYLMLFRDYGLLSIAFYLGLLLTMVHQLRKSVKSSPVEVKNVSALAFLVLVTFMFFDLAADAWFNVRLVIPLLFGYGYLVSKVKITTAQEQQCSFQS